MKKEFFLICLVLLVIDLRAQWNVNTSENTFVAGTVPLRTYCQIAADQESLFYVASWKAVPDTNKNFEFWLQLLDKDGYRQWGEDGIMISDNPSRTWLSGYDLTVDATGKAILVIEDLRSGDGFSHVALYYYDSEGRPVWDAAGIQVDTGDYASYSPVLTITPEGNVLVAWSCIYNEGLDEKYAVRIKKYAPDGTALWPGAREFTGVDSTFIYPALVSVGEDDFIMVWQRKFSVGTGVGEEWYSYIYAQRYDPDGQPSWDSDVLVCDHADTAYLMPQYLEVGLAQDESGGVFLSWNDGRFDPVTSNAFVQYLSTDGTFRWPQNGIAVSPVNESHHRTFPLVACDGAGQNVYLFWNERQNTSFGLCGQKISPDGTLEWGGLGKTFRGFSQDTLFALCTASFTSAGDLLVMDYMEMSQAVGLDTITTNRVSTYRIGPSGEWVWSPGILELATSEGIKSLPVISEPVDDMYVVSWVENRELQMLGYGSIYAQNFNLEGTLGPLFTPESINPEIQIKIFPNPVRNFLFIHIINDRSFLPVEISISDSWGSSVFSGLYDQSIIQVDVSGLIGGVYLIRLNGVGWSTSRKLLILP